MAANQQHLMQTYRRLPVGFVRGEGAWLWDEEGTRYLDAVGGIAVAILGHAHPEVAEAIADQARTLMHTSNLYRIPLQEALAARLCEHTAMEKVFFCNSGAEANEAAIKLARRYGHARDIDEPAIVVTEGAFHGRTLATLSATGNRKLRAGFEPLVSGFRRVPYNDLDAVAQVLARDSDVVAVLVEPIQGENGVVVPDTGYLRGLRALCDEHQALLMLDEVQTGMCRTGRWFACQHEAVEPDVMTLAKALGNGVPVGACLARGAAAGVLGPGSHGSTFGGNPLACRAGLAVMEIMQRERLDQQASERGRYLLSSLVERLGSDPRVRSIRGMGLMVGVELDRPCAQLAAACLSRQLLINVTAENVVRLLPPLIIEESQIDEIVAKLVAAIEQLEQ